MGAFFHAVFEDERVKIMLLLILLDLALGIIASVLDKEQGFRLSYIADFMRNDVIGKVLPFIVIYAGYIYAGNVDIVIPGVDMEVIMNGAWVIVLAALGGSLFNSLRDLGILPAAVADEIAGPDPASPEVPPTP